MLTLDRQHLLGQNFGPKIDKINFFNGMCKSGLKPLGRMMRPNANEEYTPVAVWAKSDPIIQTPWNKSITHCLAPEYLIFLSAPIKDLIRCI